MKLEFLALKCAMTEKLRDYLLGQKCIVWTNNNPLRHLDTAKLGATEQRWAARLAAFDFTIRYRPSRINGNADALSRMSPAVPQDTLGLPLPGMAFPPALQQGRQDALQQVVQAAVFALPSCSVNEPSALQEADPMIGMFLQYWRTQRRPDREESNPHTPCAGAVPPVGQNCPKERPAISPHSLRRWW